MYLSFERMQHMIIEQATARCPCGAYLNLALETDGTALNSFELKDILRNVFDW